MLNNPGFYYFVAVGVAILLAFIKSDIQNAKVREICQLFIVILASFIGLYSTFLLNAWKLKLDKRQHLADVVTTTRRKQINFISRFCDFGQLKKDSTKRQKMINIIKTVDYPYLTDIRDPVIYELTSNTLTEVTHQDENIKQLFDRIQTDTSQVHQSIYMFKMFSWISLAQMSIEVRFLKGGLTDSGLVQQSHALTDTVYERAKRGWEPDPPIDKTFN